MKAENKLILNSFVHGFAQTTAISIAMAGIIDIVKKDKNGKRHPVVGVARTLIGAGMTYATYVSSKTSSEVLIKEVLAETEAELDPSPEIERLKEISKRAETLRQEIRERHEKLKKLTNSVYGSCEPDPSIQPDDDDSF